jgi:Meiotically up-regulated gene 113
MTVYAIRCNQTQRIKIGYTDRKVCRRLKELEMLYGTSLEIVKIYPGLTIDDEQKLHLIFAQYCIKGEWFALDIFPHLDNAAEELFLDEKQFFGDPYQATYVRGSQILPSLRDSRFFYKGELSLNALKKFWRVLENGMPDISCEPFVRRSDIRAFHDLNPSLGAYQIDSVQVGRPSTGFDRKEYDRLRNQNKKKQQN